MIDRDQLRREKQNECDRVVEALHHRIPRLAEIAEEIGQLSIARIKSSIFQKNDQRSTQIDQQVNALMQEKKAILAQHGLDENIYKPQWQCPLCEDRGYIRPGELCQCYIQERLDETFQRSGIPENMRSLTFDTFNVNYYDQPTDIAEKVAKCRQLVEDIKSGKGRFNVVLLGEVGRGKTHLSVAMANAVLANRQTAIYKRIDDLLDLIREYKFDKETARHEGIFELEQLKTCDLLVIDDLGAENVTGFAINQLRIILEERNLRNKPWVINSNLSLSDLQKVYGQRVADRIIEKAVIYQLVSSESIRMQKRIQNQF